MSLISCANEALQAGKLTKQQYDELVAKAGENDDLVIKAALSENALKKRQKAQEAVKVHELLTDIQGHKSGSNTGLVSKIVRDITDQAEYANVDQLGRGIFGNYQRKLVDMLDEYRTRLAGLTQNRQGIRNMVKELFEEDSGDALARTFARAWAQVSDEARINFNRAGGAIKKRKGWRLPQHHDPLMVHKAGFDKWYDDIAELIEPLTDDAGKVLSESEQRRILKDSWEAIRTGGDSRLEPGRMGGAKLGNRRQQSRVFDFKDADSWLKYQDKYGSKDIFTTLNDWLRGISEDTALMQVFGPNPAQAYKIASDTLKQQGVKPWERHWTDAIFREQTGVGSVETIPTIAAAFGAARNTVSGAMLGGAWLSAFPDTFFAALTAMQNKIGVNRVFKQWSKQFAKQAPGGAGLKDAYRTGIVADAWLSRAIGANRYTEIYAKGITAKAADFVMRASFLSPWSEGGRAAFSVEFLASFAENAGKRFGDLPTPHQNALKRAGLSADDWAAISKAKPTISEDIPILGAEAIEKLDIDPVKRNELIAKYMGMVQIESDVAIPTPDARVRAITSLGTQKGTFIGELARTGLMFKSFPVTLITTHLYRGAMKQGLSRAAYLSSIFMATTLLGAVSMQAKDITKGLEPREPGDTFDQQRKFWVAAAAQGGGLGILGDFLFSDQNRFGGGFVSSMSSPAFSMVDDAIKLSWGNLQQLIEGKEPNFTEEAIAFAGKYTPGSSLWQLRLPLERMLIQQAQLAANPKAAKKFQRKIRKRKKDFNQDYWWKPGDL